MVFGRLVKRWQINKWNAELGEFTTWSGTYPVYWFTDEQGATIGKRILGGSIMLNKYRIERLSSDTAKYVLEHEIGHKIGVRNTYLLAGLAVVLYYLILQVIQNNLSGTVEIFSTLILIVIGSLTLVALRWWEELMAELYSLDQSSEKIFRESHREMDGQRPDRRITKVMKFLFYPPVEQVVAFYDWLAKHGMNQYIVRRH